MGKKSCLTLSLIGLLSFNTTYANKILLVNKTSVSKYSVSKAHFKVGEYAYSVPTQQTQIIKTSGQTDATISLKSITLNGKEIPAKFYQSCGQTTVHLKKDDNLYVELVASQNPISFETWFNCTFTTYHG